MRDMERNLKKDVLACIKAVNKEHKGFVPDVHYVFGEHKITLAGEEVKIDAAQTPIYYDVVNRVIVFTTFAGLQFWQMKEKMQCSMKDAAYVVLCHELGHALHHKLSPHDFGLESPRATSIFRLQQELKKETPDVEKAINAWHQTKSIIVEQEVTAWRYGEQYIPSSLLSLYNRFNSENVSRYRYVLAAQEKEVKKQLGL
jgi:hypothetical protein